jgi:hypothetical protein
MRQARLNPRDATDEGIGRMKSSGNSACARRHADEPCPNSRLPSGGSGCAP